MALHCEAGTQRPMRPAQALITKSAGTAFALPVDTDPKDWTAAGTKVPLDAVRYQFCNEDLYIALDAANDEIDLRAGVYKVRVFARITNGDAANAVDVDLAVTNAGGTVIHGTQSYTLAAAAANTPLEFVTAFHLSADAAIAVRALQNIDAGGGSDTALTAEVVTVEVEKIANVNETGNNA